MANLFAFAVPAVYSFFLVVLFTFLLVRGVTHVFVGLFLAGALIHFIETMCYILLNQMPGGLGAYQQYIILLRLIYFVGSAVSIAGFLSLASFLLRGENKLPA